MPGLIPVFTSASVTDARVEGAALTLRLESGETVSCDEYRRRCLAGEAFRGFAFAVVTAAEDRVLSLAVPPVALPHRLALVRPEDPTEFALCVLQMFLENCPAAEADAARCLRLGRWLERARAPPAQNGGEQFDQGFSVDGGAPIEPGPVAGDSDIKIAATGQIGEPGAGLWVGHHCG